MNQSVDLGAAGIDPALRIAMKHQSDFIKGMRTQNGRSLSILSRGTADDGKPVSAQTGP